MEDVAPVVALAALAGVWWWMNRISKPRGWPAWRRHSLGVLAGVLAFGIVGMLAMPSPIEAPAVADASPALPAAVENAPTTTPDQARQPEAESAAATLGLTSDEYLQRFNERLAVTDLGLRGRLQKRVVGSVNDTQTIAISDLHTVVLAIDKQTSQLTSVTYMGQGDGSAGSGGNVMVVAVTAMVAAAKDEPAKAVSTTVLDLIANRDGEDWISRVLGAVELGHQSSDFMGAVFSAEPISRRLDRGSVAGSDSEVEG